MKKLKKIILIWIIVLLIVQLHNYKSDMEKEIEIKTSDFNRILDINIIDKYNVMSKIYSEPSTKEKHAIDLVIEGIYFYDVGIRTKGTTIFSWLEKHESNKISFKIMLDYIHPEQNYNGIKEFHLNAQAMDATGIREYLIYEIYKEMGVQTQKCTLAELKIDTKSVGLVTVVEVINEDYIQKKYNSTNGNLYKPADNANKKMKGSDFIYREDDLEKYKGIFENTKTEHTTEEDKKRLVSIIKTLNESKNPKEIESCFINFDNFLKAVAINKVTANVDNFYAKTMRNYFLYEENGKIEILPFDFNLSLGIQPEEYFYSDNDLKDIGLIEYIYEDHSTLVDIIMENEVFLNRYLEIIKEVQQTIKSMDLEERIKELDKEITPTIQNDSIRYFTYVEYENEIKKMQDFINSKIENQNIVLFKDRKSTVNKYHDYMFEIKL